VATRTKGRLGESDVGRRVEEDARCRCKRESPREILSILTTLVRAAWMWMYLATK